MKYKGYILITTALIAFLHTYSIAQEYRKAAGILTSKSAYGEVVINGKQYKVDVTAEILDDRGRSLSLDKLQLQSRFYIEYKDSGGNGPSVIKLMKMLPE